MPLASAIYEGRVTHQRRRPRRHDFSYDMGYLYLDLDELPGLLDGHPLWSTRRPAPGWFRRKDYFGPPTQDLAQAVRGEIARQKGVAPTGPVRLLTHPRYWGLCFNPVSFYYVFDPTGRHLEWVLAHVTNTPWGETHAYVLGPFASDEPTPTWHPSQAKEFHVSPFMEMDMEYRWQIRQPGDRLLVVIENHDDQGKLFQAVLDLEHRPLTRKGLGRLLWAYPWQSLKVVHGIYWQALKLWAKKVPYVPHPGRTGGRIS